MSESLIAFYVIITIISIGYGIFQIALSVRLWRVLGDLRIVCNAFLSESEYQKKHSIEMFLQGTHIDDIARQLHVETQDVWDWTENAPEIQSKKQRAIEMYKEGSYSISEIAEHLSVYLNKVMQWFMRDPEILADKKRLAIELYKTKEESVSSIYDIASKIEASYEEVEAWIETGLADETETPQNEP